MIFLLIDRLFFVYSAMLLIRIIGSWFPNIQNTRPMHFISFYTDPYLALFRHIIPPLGVIDISPIVAFFCLRLLEHLTKTALFLILR